MLTSDLGLRLRIFGLAFIHSEPFRIHGYRGNGKLAHGPYHQNSLAQVANARALSAVSKAIRHETSTLFYQENSFSINHDPYRSGKSPTPLEPSAAASVQTTVIQICPRTQRYLLILRTPRQRCDICDQALSRDHRQDELWPHTINRLCRFRIERTTFENVTSARPSRGTDHRSIGSYDHSRRPPLSKHAERERQDRSLRRDPRTSLLSETHKWRNSCRRCAIHYQVQHEPRAFFATACMYLGTTSETMAGNGG